MDGILTRHNIAIPDEKIKACAELTDLAAGIYSSAEREVYIAAAAKKLDIPAESIRADVERKLRKKKSEYKKEQSQKIVRQSAGYGDWVNPDFAKNVAAAKAEEAVLGMLLLYPEHREAVRTGKVALTADDFFTDFGRRIFTAIAENDRDGSFSTSVLGLRRQCCRPAAGARGRGKQRRRRGRYSGADPGKEKYIVPMA